MPIFIETMLKTEYQEYEYMQTRTKIVITSLTISFIKL